VVENDSLPSKTGDGSLRIEPLNTLYFFLGFAVTVEKLWTQKLGWRDCRLMGWCTFLVGRESPNANPSCVTLQTIGIYLEQNAKHR
jgi:hypothetical protein